MKEMVLRRAKAWGNTMQFELVNSGTVAGRKVADGGRHFGWAYLVACVSPFHERRGAMKSQSNTMQFELVNSETVAGRNRAHRPLDFERSALVACESIS